MSAKRALLIGALFCFSSFGKVQRELLEVVKAGKVENEREALKAFLNQWYLLVAPGFIRGLFDGVIIDKNNVYAYDKDKLYNVIQKRKVIYERN